MILILCFTKRSERLRDNRMFRFQPTPFPNSRNGDGIDVMLAHGSAPAAAVLSENPFHSEAPLVFYTN